MAQGTTKGVPIDIDGTLSQNSDLLVASQKATKTYVDNGLLLKEDVIGYTTVNKGGDTMLGNLILNANPTLPLQAATKDYIDTLINGIDWKQAATAGTVSALPTYAVTGSGQILTGTSNGAIPSSTTDGVTLVAGNRVLVKNETSTLAPNNGIYVVTQVGNGSTPFILTRSDDANTPSEISEATLSVSGGSTLSNTQWHCNPASVPVVIGTTNITFAQIGSGTYTAGSGLTLTGNVFSITTNGVTDAMIQSATNWNTAYTNRITTANAPLSISSNTISISQATNSVDGYLSSTDWTTFNSKQATITLTTTGSSGSSTFISNTLNIPTYTLSGLGGVSTSRSLTINGTAYDLSADRSWSVGTVTSVAALTLGTTGTDLSSNVADGTTTPVITLNVPTASATNRGALSSTDWSTFNGKQDAITLTTTGSSGAATLSTNTLNIPNYTLAGLLPSLTSGSVLFSNGTTIAQDNANFFWDDTNNRLGIGTATPTADIDITKGVNAAVVHQIKNTTTGTSAQAVMNFIADSNKTAQMQKLSTSFGAPVAPLLAGDFSITNYSSGHMVFANNFSTGRIKFAAGGSTTAQMSLTAAGRLLLGTVTESTFILDANGTGRFTGALTITAANSTAAGGGQLYLNGATGNRIDFNSNGVAAPATTTRSTGTKIVLFPGVSATDVDFALGIESSTLWYSVPNATASSFHKWYAGTTNIMSLSGTGILTISRNQNAATSISASNTTSGTSSSSQISATSDATSGATSIGKYSTTTTAYKIIAAKDGYLYNGAVAGDIGILNDFTSGTIKFAAGGSSTAHVTIGTTGLTTFATGVDYKRLNPTTVTTASTATLTPDISAGDTFTITAQAAALSVANPTGTPVNGQKMTIRIEDNGTARAITWSGTQYRASTDLALPTTTIATKTMYLGFIYNSTDTKWDLLALLNNF
jgi:predicted heme/steroid binding protein